MKNNPAKKALDPIPIKGTLALINKARDSTKKAPDLHKKALDLVKTVWNPLEKEHSKAAMIPRDNKWSPRGPSQRTHRPSAPFQTTRQTTKSPATTSRPTKILLPTKSNQPVHLSKPMTPTLRGTNNPLFPHLSFKREASDTLVINHLPACSKFFLTPK
ncbi:hypothetical protein PGT21_029242 [Puccinia graminis f. sp. tritici]|uniref:Uncharacterized protein n=1 Tax=Puccinia graminis f. sp. tritici TaxID=56615 RepID=A0A5B0R7T1_PUCGR|nr:hypothetical protein PGT21_029242 [Puccinia graminis f. sp. tritici]KAA1121552.1 hypothetical protein PGTUg99_031978 [Puccinia graminis f. sp. tritici]